MQKQCQMCIKYAFGTLFVVYISPYVHGIFYTMRKVFYIKNSDKGYFLWYKFHLYMEVVRGCFSGDKMDYCLIVKK